jgi:23S rRNA G2445 N2-methylase RlmL
VVRDVDPQAIAAARRNAEAAGVSGDITFEVGDVAHLTPSADVGTLCSNPPYGERLEATEAGGDVGRLYASIGRTLDRMHGWHAVFLSGNPTFAKAIRRKPAISHRLWNGPLEARLLVFDV